MKDKIIGTTQVGGHTLMKVEHADGSIGVYWPADCLELLEDQ